jgi:hypothetical protein
VKLNPFKRKKRVVYLESPRYRAYPATPTEKSNSKKIDELEATLDGLKAPKFNAVEHLDKSRSRIALKFVKWYLFFVLIIIVGVPMYNRYAVNQRQALDVYKMLTQVGTLLGTPLGFVVGYYFKEDKRNK